MSGWQESNVDYPKGWFWVPRFFRIYINNLLVKLSNKLDFYADDTIAVIKSKMSNYKFGLWNLDTVGLLIQGQWAWVKWGENSVG